MSFLTLFQDSNEYLILKNNVDLCGQSLLFRKKNTNLHSVYFSITSKLFSLLFNKFKDKYKYCVLYKNNNKLKIAYREPHNTNNHATQDTFWLIDVAQTIPQTYQHNIFFYSVDNIEEIQFDNTFSLETNDILVAYGLSCTQLYSNETIYLLCCIDQTNYYRIVNVKFSEATNIYNQTDIQVKAKLTADMFLL